jgi:hypothetical protein
MRHKSDRGRCGGCASANRPPREWPVFRFCPYCGRDLGNKTSEETEEEKQEETDMERYIWTADQDEVIRGMILEGKTVADICDCMGCTDTQLKNHVAVVRRRDPSFPTLCGEVKGERFALTSSEDAEGLAGEPGRIMVEPADEGTVEPIVEPSKTEEKKADLNPLEKHMADIFVGREKTIEDLRIDLETEREARELEAAAYRNEIKRLTDLVNSLKGTVSAQGDEMAAKDKLIKKLYEDLDEARRGRDETTRIDLLRDAQDQLHDVMDEVMALNAEVHKKDGLIVAMAKAIFLGEKEVILA